MRRRAPGVRSAALVAAALAAGACATRDGVTLREDGWTVTAPDREAAEQVATVLVAYVEPYVSDLLPLREPLRWSVVVERPPEAAPADRLGYDATAGTIRIAPRAAAFPRDLLHAAGEEALDVATARRAGSRAALPWWLADGLPLLLEGLAGPVWQDSGSRDERRAGVDLALAHGTLRLGLPIDRLGGLAAAVRAGTAPTLASIDRTRPADPELAHGCAWAVCAFLAAGGPAGRDALARAVSAAASGATATLAPDARAEDRWRRFLADVVFHGHG
jgi:hypothetical protein